MADLAKELGTFLWVAGSAALSLALAKGRELILADKARRRAAKKTGPVAEAQYNHQVNELLVTLRAEFRADSAALFKLDEKQPGQPGTFSMTHERPAAMIVGQLEAWQRRPLQTISSTFLRLEKERVCQYQATGGSAGGAGLGEPGGGHDEFEINRLLTVLRLHDIVLVYVDGGLGTAGRGPAGVYGFFWLCFLQHNLPDITATERARLLAYAQQLAFLLHEHGPE